jgi:ABC-type polysaccharide/polyol phosphate transport system ATPase subunit
MTRMTVIGLAGVKTSGKSTVAKIIKQAMPEQKGNA